MSETMSYGDTTLFVLRYGPLELVCLDDLSLEDLKGLRRSDSQWGRIGVRLDPKLNCENTYDQVFRYLRVFWAYFTARAGAGWTIDLPGIASRIFLCEGLVVVGVWEHATRTSIDASSEDEFGNRDEDPHPF